MILKTNDYAIFKKHSGNTPIDPLNLKKIKNSLRINNMLELRPILVNKEMEVIDGQHRLQAALELGLDVFYTIQEKSNAMDMVLLNSAQRHWKIDDYVRFYASEGKRSYIDIMELLKTKSMTFKDFVALMGGLGGAAYVKIKAGTYEANVKEIGVELTQKLEYINQVIYLIAEKTMGKKKYLTTAAFKRSISLLMNNTDFIPDVFLAKLQINLGKVHPCTTTTQYTEMFKSIYNFRNPDPI